MSSWEERMAARAAERRRATDPDPLRDPDEWLDRNRPEWRDGLNLSPVPPPPSESDYCRECCAWQPYTIGGLTAYHWVLSCDFRCGHAHHDDEVWLADAG